MIDLFLRSATQQDALDALRSLGMTRIAQLEDSEFVECASQGSFQYALWEVGEIMGREGWHINIRVIDPDFDVSSLEPFRVFPANPMCVWA